jgi:RNA polymerase sigma-70 factor (ECF subfamily)
MNRRKQASSEPAAETGRPEPSRVEALFREHNETLVRFLRVRLHSDADAREAAQEAYVRLLQLDRPDQPSFLRAYLFKVAANVATDVLRRRAVRGPSPEGADAETPALQERALLARQQLAAVQRALDELPPRCREAFILSRSEGFGTVEIAARLGVTDRMVRLYLIRALEHLETAVQRGTGDAP